jgi:hypothetical protein
MSATKPPHDCVGNEISKDDWITLQAPFPIVWKVIAVENGGLHTPQGVTPAVVRITCDLTLRTTPGLPFMQLLRAVEPSQQKILEGLSDSLPHQ